MRCRRRLESKESDGSHDSHDGWDLVTGGGGAGLSRDGGGGRARDSGDGGLEGNSR